MTLAISGLMLAPCPIGIIERSTTMIVSPRVIRY
jgi:hypothetical protein